MLSESFWLHALLMVLPLAVVLAIAVALLRRLDRAVPTATSDQLDRGSP